MDSLVVIARGDTVRVLGWSVGDMILRAGARSAIVEPRSVRRVDIWYQSRVAVEDTTTRRKEADRAAAFFGPAAIRLDATRIMITVCSAPLCIETIDRPKVWYDYQLVDGAWNRRPPPPPRVP